ncbi:MAG: YfiR family protein [Shewanella sp.]
MKYIITISALLLTPLHARANDMVHKLAFVDKSLAFVQWSQPLDNIHFCAVVTDQQWPAFEQLNTRLVKNITISTERLNRGNSLANCNVLYLGDISELEFSYWRQQVAQLPIYSVCESWRCARENAVIGLGVEDGRLYFEFNNTLSKRANLQFNSRFLRLARTLY